MHKHQAFGPVVMTAIKEYKIDHDRVNVNGGAIALGHPIGCSGARILTTLIYAMIKKDVHNGLATLCIGGGEASAIIVRR
jgi:acetyl-CoA C-acetyltransferase